MGIRWLACLVLLAGCASPAAVLRPSVPVPVCIGALCLADAAAPDAQFMQREYNLTQVTNDSLPADALEVAGSLVVWASPEANSNASAPRDAIVAFDRATNQFFGIGTSSPSLGPPHLAQGRLVFNDGLADSKAGRVMIWDAGSRTDRAVATGLHGRVAEVAFDGFWILVLNRGDLPREDGLWAIDPDLGRRIHVASPSGPFGASGGRLANATGAFDVEGGRAFYAVDSPANGTDGAMYEVNLATNFTREVYRGLGLVAVKAWGD
ncbi:MAG: hypothetical protein ACYDBQ_10650, partial [Thermoplasmatota archaeon]